MLLSYTVDTRTFILQRAFFLGSQMSRVEIKIDWLVDWFIDWLIRLHRPDICNSEADEELGGWRCCLDEDCKVAISQPKSTVDSAFKCCLDADDRQATSWPTSAARSFDPDRNTSIAIPPSTEDSVGRSRLAADGRVSSSFPESGREDAETARLSAKKELHCHYSS